MPVPSRSTASSTSGRQAWIDMARGFCVMTVVLLHVGLFHVIPLGPDVHGRPLARAWVLFNTTILADLRMPLLLLLSGYLGRTKVRAGLTFARTRLAILTNLHLYVVWTLVFFALGVLFFPAMADQPYTGRSVLGLGHAMLYPQSGPLWFVYVLFISIAALAASRRLPAPVVLIGFFVVGWVSMAVTQDAAGLPRAIFYAVGALLGEQLFELTRSRVMPLLALLGFVVLTAAVEFFDLDPVLTYPLTVAGGICAAIAFLTLARLVAKVGVLREPGAWVGRRTLGIYVLHWPLVALLTWFGVTRPELFTGWLGDQALFILYPIAAAAVIIVAAMTLEKLLKAIGLGVLFDPPQMVKDAVTRDARTGGSAPSAARDRSSTLPDNVRIGDLTSPEREFSRR